MKNQIRLPALALITTLFLSLTGSDWKQVLKKENIVVYNRDIEGDKFKQSKVETTINYGTLDKAEKILKNIAEYKNWQPNCESSEIVKTSQNSIAMYLTFGAPWPVSDRDLIIESKFSREGKKLIVRSSAKPTLKSEDDDYVRITYCVGMWEIEEKEGGKLFLRNTNHSNPGGNIPAWLSTTAVEDIPMETMQNFIELLKD